MRWVARLRPTAINADPKLTVPQRGRTPWFRLIHVPTENAVEGLAIANLQELLEAEGYGWGDLEPVPAPASDAERRGDKSA
jgi:hypothetical protein